jgi:hypothetical protein
VFWASIDGPGTDNREGDAYNTRYIHSADGFTCANNQFNTSTPNPVYVPGPNTQAGYNYTVRVDPAAGDLSLYVYDPAQYYRPGVGGTDSDTGDKQLCSTGAASTRYRFRTYFQLYQPDSTPDLFLDDVPLGPPVSFEDDGTDTYHNKWFRVGTLPASMAVNGRFRLQVYTNDLNAAGTYGAGENQYALALGGPREPTNIEGISPLGPESRFNNIRQVPPGSDISWYLGLLGGEHAGERISFMFYDPGDATCNTNVQLFRDSDPSTPVAFDLNWSGQLQTRLVTTDMSFPVGDPRNRPYDGQWVTLGVTLPADYTADFWKLKYTMAGCASTNADRLTWQVVPAPPMATATPPAGLDTAP